MVMQSKSNNALATQEGREGGRQKLMTNPRNETSHDDASSSQREVATLGVWSALLSCYKEPCAIFPFLKVSRSNCDTTGRQLQKTDRYVLEDILFYLRWICLLPDCTMSSHVRLNSIIMFPRPSVATVQ